MMPISNINYINRQTVGYNKRIKKIVELTSATTFYTFQGIKIALQTSVVAVGTVARLALAAPTFKRSLKRAISPQVLFRLYRQTIRYNHRIKKIVDLISATALYTFRGLKTALRTSAVAVGLPLAAPTCITSLKRRVSRQLPFRFYRQLTANVESVTNFISEKILFLPKTICIFTLTKVILGSAAIYTAINKGSNYIEDISTKISQKALDTLEIPVQLNISQRQLESILKDWKSHALRGENREKASKMILDFYQLSRAFFKPSRHLNVRDCQLQELPNIFHYKPFSKITKLDLQKNQLTTLPESIRALKNLNELSLCQNELSYIPSIVYDLPRGCSVVVSQNEFPAIEVQRIIRITNEDSYRGPRILGLSIFDIRRQQLFNRTPLVNPVPSSRPTQMNRVDRVENEVDEDQVHNDASFSDLYANLYRSVSQETKDLSNLEQSQTLQSWLSRLGEVLTNTNNKNTQESVTKNIINILEEANQNEEFRTVFTNIIQDASETCGDRVALSILYLDISYQLQKIDLSDMKKLSKFLLRGCWAIQLLEQCARQKVESMRGVDELEVYLGYPIQLKERLELPISQNTMLYFVCSGLTPRDLDNAKEFVESHLDNKDAALNFLTQHDKWKEALCHNKASAIADIEREREQASDAPSPDYEAIQNSYDQALKDLSRQILDW